MTVKTTAIYQPRGKASEYCRLAANLYKGCSHDCEYCYAPACTYKSKSEFSKPSARQGILTKIKNDAIKLSQFNETGPVLLCFTCDPYQPIDDYYGYTRKTIEILHENNIDVMILTKGGHRAERDFDLLSQTDWFGVTLTTLGNDESIKWEPGAAKPEARISSLISAHEKGISTWVSLEPVLDPETALEIIRLTHDFVDKFKIGPLNYHPHSRDIDWRSFASDARDLLTELNCDYYFKNDLKKWITNE